MSKNNITKLHYPINIKPKKYPKKLTHLMLSKNFNQEIDNLPKSLTHLELNNYNNINELNNLHDSIVYLKICENEYYKKENHINIIESIIYLTLDNNFNQKIDNLPQNLTYLILDILPQNITDLTLGVCYCFNQKIDNLPDSVEQIQIVELSQYVLFNSKYYSKIKIIDISGYNIDDLKNLPITIDTIRISYLQDEYIDFIPEHITKITITDEYYFTRINKKYHNTIKLIKEDLKFNFYN